jgi:hypothetical protein
MTTDNNLIEFHPNSNNIEVRTDTALLTENQEKLLSTALNLEWGTTSFKHQWFIGEAQFTPFGKLRQWLMELKSRDNSIETIEYDISKFKVEEEIFLRDAELETDELKKKIILIEATKKRKDIERSINRVSDVYRERQEIAALIDALLDSEEGKTPDGRSLMTVFGTPEEAAYEKHYWTVRLARQAALDLSAYGRIGAGNLEAILMVAPNQQNEIVAMANHFSLTYDARQDYLRTEIARRLNTELPEKAFIGEIKESAINKLLDSDRKNLIDTLNKTIQGTAEQPNGEDLNNVYNL